MVNIYRGSYIVILTAVVLFFSCSQTKSPEIEQLELIIERDFPDIPTTHQLIPFDLSYIKRFEEYSIKSDKEIIDSISNLKLPMNLEPPPLPDPTYWHRRCRLRGDVFLQLKRARLIDKEQYDNVIKVATEVEGKTSRIEVERGVPYSYRSVVKSSLFEEFQVFAYPIMTEDYLMIYRNGYYFHRGLSGPGGGMFFIYKKSRENGLESI